jgi:hypothetical protein
MMRVEISADAQADLNEGFLFYEAQGPGLGDYFIACVRADTRSAQPLCSLVADR